jgi:3alpha(or 20beta)-hydroxysteroid dehydrogenase
MTQMTVSDLKILITGGARGIGAATAQLLAEGGAKVMITDVLDDEGEALAAAIGRGVVYRRLDVTSETDWAAAATAADATMGGINALFNNAGIVSWGGTETATPADWRRVIDINLTGCFLGIQAVVPALRRAGGGAIVNVSSTAGLQGYSGIAAYVASKWGLRGLTKAAALDLAPANIRVLSLHPGPIRTPMTNGMDESLVQGQPIPRFGDPEEVARLARFMFTEASFSTGTEFVTDGGAVTGQVLHTPES